MATDISRRTDPGTLAELSEQDAREVLADAFDRLADRTMDYVMGNGGASRADVYVCEVRVHRAQADLQRVLARVSG